VGTPVTKESPYSLDRNLWGLSIECGVLEDPWVEPPESAFQLTRSPEEAPDEPKYIEIGFDGGVPVSLDGKRLSGVELIETLGRVAGEHGVGRVDSVEDRLVGIKSREIYEAPAATVLHTAHRALESLTIARDLLQFKEILSQKYSQLVYDGLWFSETRKALDAFFDSANRWVSGTVRMRLFKGSAVAVGRKSPYSLYSKELATYGAEDIFDHKAAKGFINIFKGPLASEARRSERAGRK